MNLTFLFQPVVFYPNTPPDYDYNFYSCWVLGVQVWKKVHIKNGKTLYSFKPDSIIWFETEQQIKKFLTI